MTFEEFCSSAGRFHGVDLLRVDTASLKMFHASEPALRHLYDFLLATGVDPAAALAGKAAPARTDLSPLHTLVAGYEKSIARAETYLAMQRRNPLADKADSAAVRAEKQITEAFLAELKATLAKCTVTPPRDDCADLTQAKARIAELEEKLRSANTEINILTDAAIGDAPPDLTRLRALLTKASKAPLYEANGEEWDGFSELTAALDALEANHG